MMVLHSMAFGFRHFSVFWYTLFYSAVIAPIALLNLELMASMSSHAGRYIIMVVVSYGVKVAAYIFLVALVRRVIAVFAKKKLGFWSAMKMDVKLWVALAIFAFINLMFEQIVEYIMVSGYPDVAVIFAGLSFAWLVCSVFLVPIVTVEECGFFDAVGRSVRYVGRIFVEGISAAIIYGALAFGAFTIIAVMFGYEVGFVAQWTIGNLAHLVMHPMVMLELTPVIVLSTLTSWFFETAGFVVLVALYYAATHKLKNPYA